MNLRQIAVLGGLIAGSIIAFGPIMVPAAQPAAKPAKPTISEEASAALSRMGETLRTADKFSFQVRTLRVYAEPDGQPLHIAHLLKVTVQRPNRMLVEASGDDGSHKLIYDGKTLVVYSTAEKKYASIPVPDTIAGMMKEAIGRIGVDFPLADFLTDAPNKAFLSGVTSGRVVNTVTIDGVACDHLFFFQPPGLDLELWLEKNDKSLPRRLIVTYRSLPGEPNYIAQFSDWNLSINPSEADFTFQPPADAVRVELKPAAAAAAAKGKGSKQ